MPFNIRVHHNLFQSSSDQAVSQEFVTFMPLFLGLPAALSRIAAGVAFLKAFIDCNSKFSSYPPRGPQDPNEASVMSNGLISSCFFFMLSQYDKILYIYIDVIYILYCLRFPNIYFNCYISYYFMLSQYIYIVCYPNMMVPYDVIFPIYYVVPK